MKTSQEALRKFSSVLSEVQSRFGLKAVHQLILNHCGANDAEMLLARTTYEVDGKGHVAVLVEKHIPKLESESKQPDPPPITFDSLDELFRQFGSQQSPFRQTPGRHPFQ